MDMTLASLIEGLEKQAGLSGFGKQAEEDPKKDEKHEKDEDKAEADAKKDMGDAKKDIEKSEDDFANLKKMNKKEEAKDEKESEDKKEQTKEAQAGAEVVDFIMQKVASAQLSNKEIEMNKKASDAGKALADALMTKLANAGDQTTINGIPAGVAPNKNQIDNAQLVAEHDAIIKPMPTGNGIENQGTINQIFDAVVADALGQGAAQFDNSEGQGVAAHEGAVEASGTPNQVQTESVEKTAAVISLVNSGIDFDSAVNMVKAAAEEIEFEEGEQIKQAAFEQLLDSGVDFDLAAALVKSAGGPLLLGATRLAKAKGTLVNVGNAAGEILGGAGRAASNAATNVYKNTKRFGQALAGNSRYAAKAEQATQDMSRAFVTKGPAAADEAAQIAAKYHGKHDAVVGGARKGLAYAGAGALGLAGVAGGGYALGREKQAAVSALCDAGVDFESAVDLVQAKSYELYGA